MNSVDDMLNKSRVGRCSFFVPGWANDLTAPPRAFPSFLYDGNFWKCALKFNFRRIVPHWKNQQ